MPGFRLGLMLTVLLPTGCTALCVYRTGFGQPAGATARTPLHELLLRESENKLHALQQAQKAFFEHLDRHLAQGKPRVLNTAQLAPVTSPMTCPFPTPTYSTTGSGSGCRCT
jgi:hypothetical protein